MVKNYGMVIDLDKCVACQACTIACKIENNLPEGVFWNQVLSDWTGEYPYVKITYTPLPCMHCDKPPCVQVCPVSSRYRREDGIVLVRYERCIGCKYCIVACPYGVNYFSERKFTQETFAHASAEVRNEIGMANSRGYMERSPYNNPEVEMPPRGIVTKCTFCAQRIDKGKYTPACVDACPSDARHFGDFSDPKSIVSKARVSSRATALRKEQGTEPRVIYLL